MENASPEKIVIPNPQTPKTFGILNIVFGALLLACNVGSAGMILVMPAVAKMLQSFQKKTNEDMQRQFQARIDDLKAQEASAETEKEKAELKAERLKIENGPRPVMPSMTTGIESTNHPTIRAIQYGDLITGLLLNVPLLISGLGLVRLREWGRKLALAIAGLKLARLVVVAIVTIVVLVPLQTRLMQEQMAKLEADMKKAGAPPNPALAIVGNSSMMGSISTASSLLYYVVAGVYPAIMIWGLTRPASRAATLAMSSSKPEGDPWETSLA